MAMGALSVYAAPAEEPTGITPEEGAALLKARSLVDCSVPLPGGPGSGFPGGPAPDPYVYRYMLRWNNNGAMRYVFEGALAQTLIDQEGGLQQFAQDFNNGWQNALRTGGTQGVAAQRVFRRLEFAMVPATTGGVQPIEFVTVGVIQNRRPPGPGEMSTAISTLESLFQCQATFDPTLDFYPDPDPDLRKVKSRDFPPQSQCSGVPIDIQLFFNVCIIYCLYTRALS
jgi:hypothetical protein